MNNRRRSDKEFRRDYEEFIKKIDWRIRDFMDDGFWNICGGIW